LINLDLDDEFMRIEAAICAHDENGDAPLRKGEAAFQWSAIEADSLALLAREKDPRVAGWYCRASVATRGLGGLIDGIRALVSALEPTSESSALTDDDIDHELLAIHLGWLASPRFAHALRHATLSPDGGTLTIGDLAEGFSDAAPLAISREARKAIRASFSHALDAFASLDDQLGAPLSDSLNLAAHRAVLTDALASLGTPAGNSVNTPAHSGASDPVAS
jgi:type VI secretion system protein ImpA